MEKKYLVGLMALSLIVLMGVGMVSAIGFKNRMSDEDREALMSAIDSNDYDAWADIKRTQISEDKFNEKRARHQERAEFRDLMQEARDAGDRQLMQELKEQYGAGKGAHKRNVNLMPCNN